jgi:hypothetical protein
MLMLFLCSIQGICELRTILTEEKEMTPRESFAGFSETFRG